MMLLLGPWALTQSPRGPHQTQVSGGGRWQQEGLRVSVALERVGSLPQGGGRWCWVSSPSSPQGGTFLAARAGPAL